MQKKYEIWRNDEPKTERKKACALPTLQARSIKTLSDTQARKQRDKEGPRREA
jgi:hypothetical protein